MLIEVEQIVIINYPYRKISKSIFNILIYTDLNWYGHGITFYKPNTKIKIRNFQISYHIIISHPYFSS